MSALAVLLYTLLTAQGAVGAPATHTEPAVPVPPMPELVVRWLYPRATVSRVVERNIVPREQDVLRMRTRDSSEQVEAFYRQCAVADGDAYSVVSAVNQRIVANRFTVVTIEPVGGDTVITVVANQPELDATPETPFPVRPAATTGVHPPPS
jgi:hypothetical protein